MAISVSSIGGNQRARTAYRTSNDMTIPPKERNDRWLTPTPIVDALTWQIDFPVFDLDPCAAPGHNLARQHYLLEEGDDGLTTPWHGRVFCNPPYGREKVKWVDRMIEHWRMGGTGTLLIPADPGTIAVWQERVLPLSSAILYWRHRINFWSRDGSIGKGMVSVNESALVAFGKVDADALWTAVERGLLPGSVTYYVEGRPPL